jgi:hypothetical protein
MLWSKLIGAGGTGGGLSGLYFIGTDTNTSRQTNYTFTNVPIGEPQADRVVVVSAAGYSGSTFQAGSIDEGDCSIGGQSVTGVVERSTPLMLGIVEAAVPTGTTADITMGFTRRAENCGIIVWVYYGSYSVEDTGGTGNSNNVDLDTTSGGFVIGSSFHASSNATWTNLTEDADFQVEGSLYAAGASTTLTSTGQVSYEVDTGTSSTNVVFASWQPA